MWRKRIAWSKKTATFAWIQTTITPFFSETILQDLFRASLENPAILQSSQSYRSNQIIIIALVVHSRPEATTDNQWPNCVNIDFPNYSEGKQQTNLAPSMRISLSCPGTNLYKECLKYPRPSYIKTWNYTVSEPHNVKELVVKVQPM